MDFSQKYCTLCPRRCGGDRTIGNGTCHSFLEMRIARAALHFWEEPCISGTRGSGTVFFSGCALGCVFCQNHTISRRAAGRAVTSSQLAEICLSLQAKDAHNLNFVTGSHFAVQIAETLRLLKPRLTVPVVWNCSGYESAEILEILKGLVDIYLPDLKFFYATSSSAYAHCPDYFSVASRAILEMARQVGKPQWNGGVLQRGLLVRHLLLPGRSREAMEIMRWLMANIPSENFLFSLLGQYTPPDIPMPDKALRRRVTTMEYEKVRLHAVSLGLEGYSQSRDAATEAYLPAFDLGEEENSAVSLF